MRRDVCELIKSKIRRMGENGSGRLASEGVRQDLAKSIGLFLGLNQNYLPIVLKRRLSAFRVFEQSEKIENDNAPSGIQ
jgi:hypothetical protein